MDTKQVRANKEELLDTIKRYGELPITPEYTAFLADCFGAYKALCLACNGDEAGVITTGTIPYSALCVEPLTKDQVMCWVASIENADGKQSGHWSMEQTEQVRKQKGIDCDPVMFYAAMNMMYADYCKVAEKFNICNPDFFACMATAFLKDADAKPNKLARYYHGIAK